jgi:prevent-host-death family protein
MIGAFPLPVNANQEIADDFLVQEQSGSVGRRLPYVGRMDAEVGLRDVRQNASDIVRRVEAGESFVVTVSGRPAARLIPVGGRRWRRWDEVAAVLAGPGAPELATGSTGDTIDPFERPQQ